MKAREVTNHGLASFTDKPFSQKSPWDHFGEMPDCIRFMLVVVVSDMICGYFITVFDIFRTGSAPYKIRNFSNANMEPFSSASQLFE